MKDTQYTEPNTSEDFNQELFRIIEEKNQELDWMRRKVQKMEEREDEHDRVYSNYLLLERSLFGKLIVMPIFRRFRKYKKDTYKRDLKIIQNSRFFDEEWYVQKYQNLKVSGEEKKLKEKCPAEHYLKYGWKRNLNPSRQFRTKEYLELNSGVREREICPLLHYEKAGKYEGKQYRIHPEDEIAEWKPSQKEIDKWQEKRAKSLRKAAEKYGKLQVDPDKIVFCAYQHKYACNVKYICEELLKRNTDLNIVWLYDPKQRDYYEYPRNVRMVPYDSVKAKRELATAKVIIDNGVFSFGDGLYKKDEQITICTWHGSLGFKKMGADIENMEKKDEAVDKFSYNHGILISNSTFETEVYRNAHWPDAEIWCLGHARNDILVHCEQERAEKIKAKLCAEYKIPFHKKIVLYAPTFRECMAMKSSGYLPEEIIQKGIYDLDYDRLTDCLGSRFGGEWVVLLRHHYVNAYNTALADRIPDNVIDVTNYTDMQELMVVADVGITDYSSWILDFILTRKPGFLYAVDEDEYERDRGMYYPLRTSPFSVAQSMDELIQNIKEFAQSPYEARIDSFLEDKGCIEDGHASSRIVDKILELFA